MPAARPSRPLPAHASDAWMYLGIMLLFGSVGPMIALLHDPPGGWVYALFLYLISGSLAVGWSFMFQRRGLWFLLILPLILLPALGMPALIPRIWHWPILRTGEQYPALTRRIILLSMSMAGISIGFTVIIRYLIRVERAGAGARAELALATQIHNALVPPLDVPWRSLRVVGTSDPSGAMGGDLIDSVANDHRLDLFLADVSGHGVRAGVVMGMLKATLRTALLDAARSGGDIRTHLSTLNRVLADLIEPSMFATAVWVRFEKPAAPGASIHTTLAVAGHPPVLHFNAAANAWSEIDGASLPLGVLPAEEFQVREIDLRPGDGLVLYTDGLTEAADVAGRQLGVAGLRSLIADIWPAGGDTRAAILASVRAARTSQDDQTLVLVTVA